MGGAESAGVDAAYSHVRYVTPVRSESVYTPQVAIVHRPLRYSIRHAFDRHPLLNGMPAVIDREAEVLDWLKQQYPDPAPN